MEPFGVSGGEHERAGERPHQAIGGLTLTSDRLQTGFWQSFRQSGL
jgi:hypothetical protein